MNNRAVKKIVAMSNTYVTCILPFSYFERSKFKLYRQLKKEEFDFFNLRELVLQKKYYGDVEVSHEELDQHFLPYIERRIFPNKESEENILRYSKKDEFKRPL
ncbi:hypothetical protein [Kurthia senegalensis]|uniref:hypothetical protein n=1 Tax=Kurthia senegalensis TaxID=1033740 RepID=UPI0002D6CAA4|nr:hypothetical protein [Kurthia senegalensis]